MLIRTRSGKRGTSIFNDLVHTLQLCQEHLHSPRLPASVVAGIHLVQYIDTSITVELHSIRVMEVNNGHGGWRGERNSTEGFEPSDLTRWSCETGACLVNLANLVRHIEVAASLIHIRPENTQAAKYTIDGSLPTFKGHHRRSISSKSLV